MADRRPAPSFALRARPAGHRRSQGRDPPPDLPPEGGRSQGWQGGGARIGKSPNREAGRAVFSPPPESSLLPPGRGEVGRGVDPGVRPPGRGPSRPRSSVNCLGAPASRRHGEPKARILVRASRDAGGTPALPAAGPPPDLPPEGGRSQGWQGGGERIGKSPNREAGRAACPAIVTSESRRKISKCDRPGGTPLPTSPLEGGRREVKGGGEKTAAARACPAMATSAGRRKISKCGRPACQGRRMAPARPLPRRRGRSGGSGVSGQAACGLARVSSPRPVSSASTEMSSSRSSQCRPPPE